MENMSEEEKNFVNEVLEDYKDDKKTNTKIVKNKEKKEKSSIAPYKKISNWVAAFFVLPFLLTGVFFAFLMRAQAYLGSGTIQWLSDNNMGKEIAETAAKAGFGWLPTFLEIYEYRWIIIIACFTVCFIIAILLMLLDVKQTEKEKIEEKK